MAKQQEYGMKWYKFLIYFMLWFNAAVNIFGAVPYFTGSIYQSPMQVYTQYPLMETVDFATGCGFVLLGIFAIITRSRLANFKKSGPGCLYSLYFYGNIILPLAYNICALSVVGTSNDILLYITSPTTIGIIVGTFVAVFINRVYFKKSEDLFDE